MNWLICRPWLGKTRLWKKPLQLAQSFAILIIARAVSAAEYKIDNPITASNIQQLIDAIIKNITPLAVAFAVVAIVFAGFKLIAAVASGNEQAIAGAKKILWWVLIGMAIVVGGSALVTAAIEFAKGLK